MNQIIVVSGLPRSGTSLMMRMLKQLGIPLRTDGGDEHADEFNPHGYYEWQPMWQRLLSGDASVIEDCYGHAVKMTARLAEVAPQGPDYRVIWMVRDPKDVLASKERARKNYDQWSVAPSRASWTVEELRALRSRAYARWMEVGAKMVPIRYKHVLAEGYWVAVSVINFLMPVLAARLSSLVEVPLRKETDE